MKGKKHMNDISKKRAQIIGKIMLIGLTLTMLFLLVNGYVITKDYEKVSATMIRVETEYITTSSSETNWHQYEVYQFDYKGKQWEATRPALFNSKKYIGKKRIIKIDPQNPTILEDTSNRTIEIIVLLLCLFSLYIVRKNKKK